MVPLQYCVLVRVTTSAPQVVVEAHCFSVVVLQELVVGLKHESRALSADREKAHAPVAVQRLPVN